ncbi:hypothetical protein HGA88_06195 [Candidatus Roizmanbacteria bacterium]|nr:hypothetical protein [Candidatus Roizmanbacteria bacterium]
MFLLLDEPKNHFEIETREVIENVLQNYQGALLDVSYDRYFLEQIRIGRDIGLSKHDNNFL